MATTEIYKKRLLANYNSLLLILGLKSGDNDVPIYDFLVDSRSKFKYYYSDKKSFKNNRIRLESSVAELAKISDSASFTYMGVLDFTPYERIDYLLDLILSYQDVNSVTAYMDDEIKKLIEYMTLLENTNGSVYKNTLSYMTIRNFLMFLVNKHFLHASVYANFIKEQIFLSEGLSPKIKFTDIYKGELGLTIERERARYSNKIRKVLKSQVEKIVKNTSSKIPKYKNSDEDDETFKKPWKDNKDSQKSNFSKREDLNVVRIRNAKTNKGVDYHEFDSKIDKMVDNRNKSNNGDNSEEVEYNSPRYRHNGTSNSNHYSDYISDYDKDDDDEFVSYSDRSSSTFDSSSPRKSQAFDEHDV